MKFFRYFYIKLYYFIYKFFFSYLSQISNKQKISSWKNFFDLLTIISIEFFSDYYLFRENLARYIFFYKKLNFIKKLLLLFLFLKGWIFTLFIIYLYFFSMKYLFKYLFIILDFLLFYNESKYKYYYFIRNLISNFFYIVPLWSSKIYKFFMENLLTLNFLKDFKYYIKKKKRKIFFFILDQIDYFIDVYGNMIVNYFSEYDSNVAYITFITYYYKTKRFILRVIPWRIKRFLYYKVYIKLYNFFVIGMYYNSFLKRTVDSIYIISYRIKRFYFTSLTSFSDLYHYFFYKYKYTQYYSIYLYKAFLRSYACYVAIEGFFLVNYWHAKAYFFFSFSFLFWTIHYSIISKIYELERHYFKRIFYLNYFIYDLKRLKIIYINKILDEKSIFYADLSFDLLSVGYFIPRIVWQLFLFDLEEVTHLPHIFRKTIVTKILFDYHIIKYFMVKIYWLMSYYKYYYNIRFCSFIFYVKFKWFIQVTIYKLGLF